MNTTNMHIYVNNKSSFRVCSCGTGMVLESEAHTMVKSENALPSESDSLHSPNYILSSHVSEMIDWILSLIHI